jgi:hypothetical protein
VVIEPTGKITDGEKAKAHRGWGENWSSSPALPVDITPNILGSSGAALVVASGIGATGALLARAGRFAFMSSLKVSFLVAAVVSFAGVVTVLVRPPSRALPVSRDPLGERLMVIDRSALTHDDCQPVVSLEGRDANGALGQRREGDVTITTAPGGARRSVEGPAALALKATLSGSWSQRQDIRPMPRSDEIDRRTP